MKKLIFKTVHGFKRRRHAVRLRESLGDLRDFGRFNPQISDGLKFQSFMAATLREGDDLRRHLLG